MVEIKKIEYVGLSIPFNKTVETSWSKRSGTTVFVIIVETRCGNVGYGEIISFFNPNVMKVCIERMISEVKNSNYNEISKIYQRAIYDSSWMRTGRLNDLGGACWAGIETAIYNAYSKKSKIPMMDFFGGLLNNSFSLAANLSYHNISQIKKDLKVFVKKGYQNIFTKVAKNTNSLKKDIELINNIFKIAPEIGLCLDANGAWTISTSLRAISILNNKKYNIKCLEQPVMEPSHLKRLKKISNFPIGVNEILNSSQSIVKCAQDNVADIFVLDIFECGGLRNMYVICKFLEICGYQVICRAHGNPGISYITSLGILGCTNSSAETTPMQIYDFHQPSSYIKWKPKIKDGKIHLNNSDFDFEIDFNKINKFAKYFQNGKKYFIYSNKKTISKPIFPKY
jgi:L-alanine-DL-glutamate epimerase-like enolase superfamily enzyme